MPSSKGTESVLTSPSNQRVTKTICFCNCASHDVTHLFGIKTLAVLNYWYIKRGQTNFNNLGEMEVGSNDKTLAQSMIVQVKVGYQMTDM